MAHMVKMRSRPSCAAVLQRWTQSRGEQLLRPSICAIQSRRAITTNAAVREPGAEFPVGVSPASVPRQEIGRDRKEAIKTAKPFSDFLTDTFSRQHDYLRISITERCNLRCLYCMPEEGVPLSPPANMLTTPEIFYLASLFVSQGVTKIRLTGGEPTVRRDVVPLMQQIGSLRSKGLRELALTTNGISLHRKLDAMVEAGLTGVNLSLDTLDPFQFQIMTRRKGFDAVMKSIDRILEMNKMGANIKLKVNCVVMRGLNEREILPFVELGREKEIETRFIEYMPFGGNKWSENKMISFQEMLDIIRTKYPGLRRVPGHKNDTSKTFEVPGFVGKVGFITSMTNDFCGTCNRLRITSDGNLKVCLHGNDEVSLRDLLRQGNNGEPIDQEAFERIRQIEMNAANGRLSGETILGWGKRERDLLDMIGVAVKRKAEKHADLNDLANMENRPMILIDEQMSSQGTRQIQRRQSFGGPHTKISSMRSPSYVLPSSIALLHSVPLLSYTSARAFSSLSSIVKEPIRGAQSTGHDFPQLTGLADDVQQTPRRENTAEFEKVHTEVHGIHESGPKVVQNFSGDLRPKKSEAVAVQNLRRYIDRLQHVIDVEKSYQTPSSHENGTPLEQNEHGHPSMGTISLQSRKAKRLEWLQRKKFAARIALVQKDLEDKHDNGKEHPNTFVPTSESNQPDLDAPWNKMTKLEIENLEKENAVRLATIESGSGNTTVEQEYNNTIDKLKAELLTAEQHQEKIQDMQTELGHHKQRLQAAEESLANVNQRIKKGENDKKSRSRVRTLLERRSELMQQLDREERAEREPRLADRRKNIERQNVERENVERQHEPPAKLDSFDLGDILDDAVRKLKKSQDPHQARSSGLPASSVNKIGQGSVQYKPGKGKSDIGHETRRGVSDNTQSDLRNNVNDQRQRRPSENLRLHVANSGLIFIDSNLTIDLEAPVAQLQSHIFQMQERLRTSYPRIDTLPYDVWESDNRKTLQTWLKILVSRWRARFNDVDDSSQVGATDGSTKAVLDKMVQEHNLSNEAAERMAMRFRELFKKSASNTENEVDKDDLDPSMNFLRDATTSSIDSSSELGQQTSFTSPYTKPPKCDSTIRRSYSTSSRVPPFSDISSSASTAESETQPANDIPTPQPSLPHLTSTGAAHMVSVSAKQHTVRTAIAVGTVSFSNPTPLSLIHSNSLKKGDVLSVSRIAGIMAAKKCPDLVPLCHPISLTAVGVELTTFPAAESSENLTSTGFGGVAIQARVQCTGPTGVEMEALTAVMGAALSVVDMCKAVDKGQRIEHVRVVLKEGGKSGVWREEGWSG